MTVQAIIGMLQNIPPQAAVLSQRHHHMSLSSGSLARQTELQNTSNNNKT